MNTIKQSIITIIACISVVAGVSLVYSWTGPTQTPPGGNVDAPINVSGTAQVKTGALSIGGLLQVGGFKMTSGAGAGKVLTSDASGLASWQTGGGASGVSQIIAGTNITISPTTGTGVVTINSTGGGGYWALSGTNIYNTNTGNVGIGTTTPSQKLDVAGYVKGQSGLCIGNDCRSSWPSAVSASSAWGGNKWVPNGTQISATSGIPTYAGCTYYARVNNGKIEIRIITPTSEEPSRDTGWVNTPTLSISSGLITCTMELVIGGFSYRDNKGEGTKLW
jgi:hypothetical protein